MSIQLFSPAFEVEECLDQVRECLEKGWTGLGYKTIELEEKWKDYTGLPHAHFVNSATVGLELALRVLRLDRSWAEGDEVITTSLTFVSTNHSIMHAGLKPVFADVDQYLCLDPNAVLAAITPRTRAVVFVGLGGSCGQWEAMVDLCRSHGLTLILDAAHMAGTRLRGTMPGREADAVVYSYQAVKNLPTGDSGMVCFANKLHDELCRKLSWLGINKDTYARSSGSGAYKWKYDVEHVGYKYHGNSIMAGIALVQLKYLDRDNAYRRQVAAWYQAGFAGADAVTVVTLPEGCESSRHLFQILVDNRDDLLEALNAAGIYPGVHYRDNTEYAMYADGAQSCPNARRASDRLLSLPMHLRLTEEDVRTVITEVIKNARVA